MARATLGVILGNRDFFPDRLISEARRDLVALFEELDIEAVLLEEHDTKLGSVETFQHARRCADLFRQHRDRIEGVLVCLPNFGDEKGVADTLRMADLGVPVLVQGYPDDLDQLSVERRRDAFCGKISVCNNLRQYGIPFSLTEEHTVHPLSDSFKADLKKFIGICKVKGGMKGLRLGAVGARPGNFNTVRYSEKLLEQAGITVVTVDFSEILGNAQRFSDDHPRVSDKLREIQAYARHGSVPTRKMVLMAKLGLALGDWMAANEIKATALQCWTSLQQNYGVNACTIMSMMSENLLPSACEVDITGVLAMYALQLASGTPSALVDWNNNYAGDPNKCVFFHCGNWARSFLPDIEISVAPILGSTLGVENTYGALAGRTPAGPMSFARISTDDREGRIRAYVGEGRFTDDPLQTFGNRAVVEVPGLQKLMKYICKQGFEHHVAMSGAHVADVLVEAFENYLGWETYHHQG
ncbi:MAG: L-fucose/L-arabinose isomerase family protein [Chloroflexi bacterium OHK40]